MRRNLFLGAGLLACCLVMAKGEGLRPLMGWSSWNAYMVDINDSIIRHQADMVVRSGLRDAGYAQVNIDDGFFGPRDEQGRMTANPKRFPNGMKVLADYIHSLGMKAGIYSDAGANTCGSYYNHDELGKNAGLYGHDVEDMERYFNEWGYDFFKLDFCGGQKAGLDEEARYRQIRHRIDSIAKHPVAFNICRWDYPGTWVAEVGNSWRTTYDIRPNWKNIRGIIEQNLYLSAYCRGGCYNDMDMLCIGYEGNPSGLGSEASVDIITKDFLNPDEEDAHFGIWCIMNSPLLVGCKIEGMPKRSLELLKNRELIALNQDPLCQQAYVVQHVGKTYVLAKDLLRAEGPTRAVCLYNPWDYPVLMSVTTEEIGYAGKVKVRDLLRHENLPSTDVIRMVVPAHGVQMLRTEGQRQELTRYEAEWAFMPRYSEIKKGPYYRPEGKASGRMVADGLGGEGNTLVWEKVFSKKGGTYALRIHTSGTMEHGSKVGDISLSVNGKEVECQGGSYTVRLQKGYNTVVLSSEGHMPAIDCMDICPQR